MKIWKAEKQLSHGRTIGKESKYAVEQRNVFRFTEAAARALRGFEWKCERFTKYQQLANNEYNPQLLHWRPAHWARLGLRLCSWQRLRRSHRAQSHVVDTIYRWFHVDGNFSALLARLLRVDPVGRLALGRRHFDLVLQTDSLQTVAARKPNAKLRQKRTEIEQAKVIGNTKT